MDARSIISKINAHQPTMMGIDKLRKYAVLLPLVQLESGLHILFEKRSQKLRRQPGDICFPGGRIDEQDISAKAAALRETHEELGISSDDISDVSALDHLVSPFGIMVYPFVGMIHSPESITPNPSEVEDSFMVPLSFFLEEKPQIHRVHLKVQPEENFPYELIAGGEDYDWRTQQIDEHFYLYEDKTIWGLTAKIIAHFVEVIS